MRSGSERAARRNRARVRSVSPCAPWIGRFARVAAGLALSGAALAGEASQFARCAWIEAAAPRLACYDAAAGREAEAAATADAPPVVPENGPPADPAQRSLLGDRWGLGAPPPDSRLDVLPHRATYFLLARHSDAPNRLPASPARPAPAAPLPTQDTESKFQLSFKLKLADFGRRFGAPLAVWAAYTQQSHWQVYDVSESRPFRETNYEPEIFVAAHPDLVYRGWRWRLAAVGINHESNGRPEPQSRSWNRVMAQIGVERGDLGILLRPWVRIAEDAATDDNPDITRYLGYGDLTVVWAPGAHRFSLSGRLHPGSGYGAVQAHWSFPLARRVRGLVQVFSGYGESLIDYNARQTTFGVGVLLADSL